MIITLNKVRLFKVLNQDYLINYINTIYFIMGRLFI